MTRWPVNEDVDGVGSAITSACTDCEPVLIVLRRGRRRASASAHDDLQELPLRALESTVPDHPSGRSSRSRPTSTTATSRMRKQTWRRSFRSIHERSSIFTSLHSITLMEAAVVVPWEIIFPVPDVIAAGRL